MPGLAQIYVFAPELSYNLEAVGANRFGELANRNSLRRLVAQHPRPFHPSSTARVQFSPFESAAGKSHDTFLGFSVRERCAVYHPIRRLKAERKRIITSCSSSESLVHEDTVTIAGRSVGKESLKVFGIAVCTVLLATCNKVLFKMALVPMNQYPFFLAQFTTFGYVLVYFSILYFRFRAGIVTKEMLNLPKGQFVAMGALEALGIATNMSAAAVLPAASIPVLLQTFLVWQLILSAVLLRKKYTKEQIVGCLLVVTGVILVVSSGGGAGSTLERGLLWPFVMMLSAFFSASASILKESAFRKANSQLKGGSVDIFVVNSFGSGFQALFVLLLLPFLSKTRGIPFGELVGYFKEGAACFVNAGSLVPGCQGAPLVPLLYVAANMSFNISALALMKSSSAIVSSLATTASVPLAIYAFTLPLPYLGIPPPMPPGLFYGSMILVVGLAAYNLAPKVPAKVD
ncbi:hypothetical protein MPTK1_7g15820 [Marchantia polymorpha subsp. ruderalis]|uniref:EamA domain-containing protein n=2 Tax=Marchantia polymorpha TaxID=3197 RepID=A0A176VJB9_MARPO|nr:hypothetical protein AXG93_2024s1170 [Marchantia polymorpha subsp. ruderalis]PTQ31481.1 hypothetical protein MARPO_0111s0037 [Marchantia polymorpha]BBN17621.1 hypothetical protein Mp_7g15820 [Marchantia polymorpha subsp. ruderalis]|eukprot:PTQ31481.1 hypothetical protein MARPO_0111s0037 [Marchantia polymorpha]